MRVNTGVLIRIIVEPDGFGLRARETWTAVTHDERLHILHGCLPRLRHFIECIAELLEVDLACGALLAFRENEINVRRLALSVEQLAVLA